MPSDFYGEALPSILTQYNKMHGLGTIPIKVDFLRPMIEERGWVDRIIWERFAFESRRIAAQITCYTGSMGVYAGDGKHARIQFSSGLNFCWSRFAILKEMYHCMIDETPEDRVCTVADLLKLAEMIVSSPFATIGGESFDPYETEMTAEILALETLFPLELRTHHEAAYRSGEITDYQLALRYRIPEEYARLGMGKGYLESVKKLRGETLVSL